MHTRKVSAHYIFTGNSNPIKYGIIEFSYTGYIIQCIETGGNLAEAAGIEFYSGILTPAFIISPFMEEASGIFDDMPQFPDLTDFFSFVRNLTKEGVAENIDEMNKILKSLVTVQESNPQISLKSIISLVTWQAACNIGIQNEYGSLEAGKKPGI